MLSLKVLVEERLAKKLAHAEAAYIKAHTTKATTNCHHHGREISDGTFVCKLQCTGANELQASQCWNEKAQACVEFRLQKAPETLRAEFRRFPETEIALRWPSIGELQWVLRQIQACEKKGDPVPEGDQKRVG